MERSGRVGRIQILQDLLKSDFIVPSYDNKTKNDEQKIHDYDPSPKHIPNFPEKFRKITGCFPDLFRNNSGTSSSLDSVKQLVLFRDCSGITSGLDVVIWGVSNFSQGIRLFFLTSFGFDNLRLLFTSSNERAMIITLAFRCLLQLKSL